MPYTRRGPRLYYERTGSGEPMLFVTGWMLSAAVFETILPLYAEHFDCITYDNRWAGRSAAPPRPTSIAEMATDATRLLDELGLDSAHVYGISLGGMIALEIALRHPDRVRGLVLTGTSPGGPRAAPPGPRMIGSLVYRLARDVVRQRSIDPPPISAFLFTPEFPERHPERASELLEPFGRHRVTPWGAAAQTLATVFHETVSRLPEMQAPTLLMHGGRDSMAPRANSRIMAGLIPDAELIVVPDSGHAFPLERPELSLELLLGWLERHSPIPAGRPRTGPSARLEPLTRALGLPIGMLRTGQGLLARVVEGASGRRRELTRGEAPESPVEQIAELPSEDGRGVEVQARS